jgi:hypothetical protein
MSDLEQRWERLARAARGTPPSSGAPVGSAWIERMAQRGLRARAARPRPPEPLAWAGLAALAAMAAAAVLLWPGPLVSATELVTRQVAALPRTVPHAPRLPPPPVAPRPTLPPADATLAALSRWHALALDVPFTSPRTETP